MRALQAEAGTPEESQRAVRDACNRLDDEGMAPLHLLVEGQCVAGAELLLEAGADVYVCMYVCM